MTDDIPHGYPILPIAPSVSKDRPKYTIGRNRHGKPHFMLYPAADEHARRAMAAYAASCEGEYPEIAALIQGELDNL
jgi:hypothetical protein